MKNLRDFRGESALSTSFGAAPGRAFPAKYSVGHSEWIHWIGKIGLLDIKLSKTIEQC